MELNRITRVEFFPFTHSYILDGHKVLIGVTQLMHKHGLSANYSRVDEATLQHAADLGSQAHKAIEDYCDGKATVETTLIRSFKRLGLNIVATEYLVSDYNVVASSIDLVNEVDEDTVDLIDMKRTSSVHKDALAWQLGIYRYLFLLLNPGKKVRNCYCLPIKKGNKDDILKDTCSKLVEITPVPESKVVGLINAEMEGRTYTDPDNVDANALYVANTVEGFLSVGFGDALRLLAEYQAKAKEVEQHIAGAKEQIYNEMLARGVDKVEVGGVSITLKRPYEASKFDGASFKKDHPEVYESYLKTSEVKGSITIKIK